MEVCHLFTHPLFSVGPEKNGPEIIDVRDLVFQYSQQFPVLTPPYQESDARFTRYEIGTDKPSKPYHGIELSNDFPCTPTENHNGPYCRTSGVLIESVAEGSPADLEPGMRIAHMTAKIWGGTIGCLAERAMGETRCEFTSEDAGDTETDGARITNGNTPG